MKVILFSLLLLFNLHSSAQAAPDWTTMCAAIGESASEIYRLTNEVDNCDATNSGCSQTLRKVNLFGTATFDVVIKTRSGKTFTTLVRAGKNAYVGCRVSFVSLPVQIAN